MLDKKEVAVVIPIYKTNLNTKEKVSLQQALTVLGRYDVVGIAPEDLYITDEKQFSCIERFSSRYFESIETYNILMLSDLFYRRFEKYEYILIYQLDAFVFEDKLSFFCQAGYDYIGAPWLNGMFHYVDESRCIWHVGNGGLSLRRVKSIINLLEEKQPLQMSEIPNEDLFFSSSQGDKFTIAPVDIALQFAFERQVTNCFERNNFKLPFGCHAWDKYDYNFWKPYIEKEGGVLDVSDRTGKEDFILQGEYEWSSYFSCLWKDEDVRSMLSKELMKQIVGNDEEYLIFGAGYFGRGIGRWLVCNSIPFKGYCDNNERLSGGFIEEYLVISPNSLRRYKGKVKIIISILNHIETIECQLQEMGFVHYEDYMTFDDLIVMIRKRDKMYG